MSFYDYIEKEIFTPLEMSDSVADWDKAFSNKALGYYDPVRSNTPQKYPEVNHTHLLGTGNLFSTVEDLYLWYQALHGDEAWKPYDCSGGYGRGYGYRAAFIPIHALDIVVIILSNFFGDGAMSEMVSDIEEILLEDDLVALDESVMESFAGEYHALMPDGGETTIRISRVGDHLIVVDIGSNLLGFSSLYPLSQEGFILKNEYGYGPTFDFKIDDSDKISQMIIDDVLVVELTLIE
jgi:hypothetical protein